MRRFILFGVCALLTLFVSVAGGDVRAEEPETTPVVEQTESLLTPDVLLLNGPPEPVFPPASDYCTCYCNNRYYVDLVTMRAPASGQCSELNGSPCPEEYSSSTAYNCFAA